MNFEVEPTTSTDANRLALGLLNCHEMPHSCPTSFRTSCLRLPLHFYSTYPKAVYVHCNSHRLNLVLSAAAESSGHVSTFFTVINQIHNFFTGAQRHARFMENQKEMHPQRPCKELERSCETRWNSKSGSVSIC